MVLLEIESKKKTLQYVYLGFLVGVGVVEKLFLECESKAVTSDNRKVNGPQCRQSQRRSYQQKEVFRDALLDLVGINLRICGIFILLIADDVFDVGRF